MATYPIKILKDEQGTPFVPLVSSDSVQTLSGDSLTELLDEKLSPEDLVAGQYIELKEEEGKTVIGVNLPASANTINNLITETPGQGALDAYQGKVLNDSIPKLVDSLESSDAGKALSARQGKILAEMSVPEGGKTGQVLKKSSDNDHELEWGDAADPNAIVGDGSIMSIVELSYAEYKELEATGELQEDTEYHISEMGGDPGSGTGGSGLSEADVQYMIDASLEDIESVPVGGFAGQVLKKTSNEDHALEWGDAADPNAIVGDGSIMKIVELSYEVYLELEAKNQLQDDTEYHISDWNENERTYLTDEDIQKKIEDNVIDNTTSSATAKSLSAAQGQKLQTEINQLKDWQYTPSQLIAEVTATGFVPVLKLDNLNLGPGTYEIVYAEFSSAATGPGHVLRLNGATSGYQGIHMHPAGLAASGTEGKWRIAYHGNGLAYVNGWSHGTQLCFGTYTLHYFNKDWIAVTGQSHLTPSPDTVPAEGADGEWNILFEQGCYNGHVTEKITSISIESLDSTTIGTGSYIRLYKK